MMQYIRLYTDSKSMNSYYYEEQTGEMFLLEQKSENGLAVGIIAGISLVIYAFVRKIEKPIFLMQICCIGFPWDFAVQVN